jgi:hypothetical protein
MQIVGRAASGSAVRTAWDHARRKAGAFAAFAGAMLAILFLAAVIMVPAKAAGAEADQAADRPSLTRHSIALSG